jgi:serine/threonine-protein kinase
MGGMGAVFQVRHLSLGKTFALKIIHQGLSSNPQMQTFFFREAQVLSHLSHPGIVQVTDFGEDERFGTYLVMELLEGESLHARLQRETRLGIAASLQVALQVAEALAYMHGLDLIHCDIKPENIFLCREPVDHRSRIVAKIIDFGLSRSMAKGARLNAAEVGGTPHFAAPEQLAGLAPQPSMDIYAVGELLYTMITGALPFSGSYTEVYTRKSTERPPLPSAILGEPLDAQLESLILKALEPKPEHRHGSMSQIVFELRTILDMLGLSPRRRGRQTETHPTPASLATLPLDPGRLCDLCTLPVFLMGPDGRLRSASPMFARVVHARVEELPGKRLEETHLGAIYPALGADLEGYLGQRSALQRRLRVNLEGGHTLSLYLWLVPRLDEQRRVIDHWGLVMPVAPGAE